MNIRDISTSEISKHLKFKDNDALYIALGAGDVTSAAIATALQNLRRDDSIEILKKQRHRRPKGPKTGQAAINGIGDLLSTFARCCRPVPPEHIAGYITQGRGVTIHRQDCGNFLSLNSKKPERIIEVDWGESGIASYPAELTLYAFDRQGLLRDISTVLADEKISVLSVQTKSEKQRMQAVMELSIEVPGLPSLSRIISRLELVPNVTSVRRRN